VDEPGIRSALLVWVVLPYVLAGLVAWWRRPESRFGPLMVTAGFATFLSALQWSNQALPYTIGLVFDLLPAVIFLHVFLAFPSGRLERRPERWLVGVGYFVAVGFQLAKMLLGGGDPDNLAGVVTETAAANTVEDVQLVTLSAVLLTGIVLLVIRRRDPVRPLRPSVALFGGLALVIAMFVVASTIGLSVLQRQREVALLRAVAATPKQVRRMIRWEIIVVALLASVAGLIPGAALAGWLGGALSDRGIAPEDMEVTVGAVPVIAAVGSSVLTALIAVAAAGRRAARVRPTLALQESASEPRLIGPVRVLAGLLTMAGGIGLLAVAVASGDSTSTADLAALTSLLLVVAVALLGPLVARVAASLAAAVLGRSGNVSGFLAVSNMRTASRRFSSAMTPIVLTVAISSTLVFTATTREHAGADQERQRVTADLVLQSDGVGIPRSALDEARRVPGVETAVGTAETSLGPSLGSVYSLAQAVMVDTQGIEDVLDLNVTHGSLADLDANSIAPSKAQADTAGADAGDRVEVALGDGTRRDVRVAAVYERGLGFGDAVLPTALAAAHVTNPMLSSVLIRTAPGASPEAVASRLERLAVRYPDLTVGDRHEHAARVDANRESNNWLFRILSGIIFAFTAIAVVNTLTMIALHRTRELALLRLVGGTRSQVLAMARWEGGMVVGLGIAIGGAIALITLIPTSSAISGSPVPYAPVGVIALVIGASAAVGLLATQFSTRLALRPRPVDGIGLND
jgi:putative ABC transport system permease protein